MWFAFEFLSYYCTLILRCILGLLCNEPQDCMPEFARLLVLYHAWYLFLWVVADVPLDFSNRFHGKYHYDSTYILWKVVRASKLCCSLVWETFRYRFFALSVEFGTKAVPCYVKGYHHHRLQQSVWSNKISPLSGCLHCSGLILFGGCWTSSIASVYQTMKPCIGQYYPPKAS